MSSKPKLDIDRSREHLESLGLGHAADALERTLSSAVKESVTAHAFLDQLLRAELDEREQRRLKTSLRLSSLPTGMTLPGASTSGSNRPSSGRGSIRWEPAPGSVLPRPC